MSPHHHPVQSRAHGRKPRPAWAALVLLCAFGISTALAATRAAPLDPRARLRHDNAACAAVRSADERANCLSEASTRFAATQPANPDESPQSLLRNALKRCEPLPDAERRDCVARMQGAGSTRGSAEAGGIYRELVTIEVGVPAELPAQPVTP
jgi:hypothetical protein